MPTLPTDPHLERRTIFLSVARKRAKSAAGSSLNFLNKGTWTLPVTDIRQFIQGVSFVVVGGEEILANGNRRLG